MHGDTVSVWIHTPPPASSVLGVAGRVLGASMVILGSFLSSSDYTLMQAS